MRPALSSEFSRSCKSTLTERQSTKKWPPSSTPRAADYTSGSRSARHRVDRPPPARGVKEPLIRSSPFALLLLLPSPSIDQDLRATRAQQWDIAFFANSLPAVIFVFGRRGGGLAREVRTASAQVNARASVNAAGAKR
uniref:Uncharacterized protein n=1 Tax=Plectus sambesii TaxID=2011161 RepID=A0A914WIA7_9BILA